MLANRRHAKRRFEQLENRRMFASFPLPMTPIQPLSSGVYETATTGFVAAPDSVERLAISLHESQFVQAIVVPTFSPQDARVEFSNASGEILATGELFGSETTIRIGPVRITESGDYSFSIDSPAGEVGAFSIRLVTNAFFEAERFGGETNDSIDSATPLIPVWEPIAGTHVSTVLGTQPSADAENQTGQDWYRFSLEDGETSSITLTARSAGAAAAAMAILHQNGQPIDSGEIDANGNLSIPVFADNTHDGQRDDYYVLVSGDALDYTLSVVTNGVFGLGQRVVDTQVVLGEKSADFSAYVADGQSLTIETQTLQLGDLSLVDDTSLRIEAFDHLGRKVAVEENSAEDGRNARMTVAATDHAFRRFRVTSSRQSIHQQRGHRTVAVLQKSGQARAPVLKFTGRDGGSELTTNEAITSLEFLASDRLRQDIPIALESLRLNGDPVNSIRVENVRNSSRVLVTFETLAPGRHLLEFAPGAFVTMNGLTNDTIVHPAQIDDEPPTLVRSTISQGDILQTGRRSIELEFSEPIQGPTPWDQVTIQGVDDAIIDPIYDHSTNTLKFDLDLPENQYQLSIGVSDLAGNSIEGDHDDDRLIINFQFDTSTEELEPTVRLESSSLLEATTTGRLQTSEDQDAFSIDLSRDQPITFRAWSASVFDVRLQLFDPNDVLVFDSLDAEQTVPVYRVIQSGRHTFVVSSANRPVEAPYHLEVLVNGHSELELDDRTTNDSINTAEEVGETLNALPFGNRLTSTIVGNAKLDQTDWYSFTLDDAEFLTLVIDTRFHDFAVRDAHGKLITRFLPGFIPSPRYETSFRDITNNGISDRYYIEIHGYTHSTSEYALQLTKAMNRNTGREFSAALHASNRESVVNVPLASGETVQIDIATIPIGDSAFTVDLEISNAARRDVISHQIEEGTESFRYRANDSDVLRISLRRVSGEGWFHLQVSGEDLVPQPFSVSSITPRVNARIPGKPEFITLYVGWPLNLSTVDPADLTVNGLPAIGIEIIKLSHLRFKIDPASLVDTSVIDINLPAGVLTGLTGATNEALTSTYVIDTVGPSLLSSSLDDDNVVPPGPLKIAMDFGTDLDARSIKRDVFELVGETFGVIAPDDTRFDSDSKNVILEFSDLREDAYTLRTREREEPTAIQDLAGNSMREAAAISFTVDIPGVIDEAETLEFERIAPAGSLASQATLHANLYADTDVDVFALPMPDGSFFELIISPDADDASLRVQLDDRIIQAGPGEPIRVPAIGTDESNMSEQLHVHVQSDRAVNYIMDVLQNAIHVPTDRGVEVVDIGHSALSIDTGTRYAAIGSAVPSATTTESAGPDRLFLQTDWQVSRLATLSLSAKETFRLSDFDVQFADRDLTRFAFDGQFIWTEIRRTLRKHDLAGNVLSEATIPGLRIRSLAVDTHHVYTVYSSPSEIRVFDKETFELLSSLQYGYEIRDLANFDVDELVLLVGAEVHFVSIVDGKTTRVLPLPDRFREADHIAVVDNKIYILTERKSLAEFTLEGTLVREIPVTDSRNLFGSNIRFAGDVVTFSVPTDGIKTASVIVQAETIHLDSIGSVRILDANGTELAPNRIANSTNGYFEAFFENISGLPSLTIETNWTYQTDYIILVITDAIFDSSVGSTIDNLAFGDGFPIQRSLIPDSPTIWGVNDFELVRFTPEIDTSLERFLMDEPAVGHDALAFDGRYLYVKTAAGLQQLSPTNGQTIKTFPWTDITRHGFIPDSIDFAFGEIYLAYDRHVDVFDPRSGLRRTSRYQASGSFAFDSQRGLLYLAEPEGIVARNIATSEESQLYRLGRREAVASLTVVGDVLYASFEQGDIQSFQLPIGMRQVIHRSDNVRFNGLAGDTFRSHSDERQTQSHPTLSLDRKRYRVLDPILLTVKDADMTGSGKIQATVKTTSGDGELVDLIETRPGVFAGTLVTQIGSSLPEDGLLSMSANDSIVARYASGRPNREPLSQAAWVAPKDHYGTAIFSEDIIAGEKLLVSISNLSAIVDPNPSAALAVVTDRFGNALSGVRVVAGTEQIVVPIETSGTHAVHVYAELNEVQVSTRVRTIGDRTDMNGDGTPGIEDVDSICRSIAIGEFNEAGDVNYDGKLNGLDLDLLVRDVLRSSAGDTNLDGRFDSADLVSVFQKSEYEDSIQDNSIWSTGDWNCDGEFTSSDLVRVFRESPHHRNALTRRSDISAAIHGSWDAETQNNQSQQWRLVDIK